MSVQVKSDVNVIDVADDINPLVQRLKKPTEHNLDFYYVYHLPGFGRFLSTILTICAATGLDSDANAIYQNCLQLNKYLSTFKYSFVSC